MRSQSEGKPFQRAPPTRLSSIKPYTVQWASLRPFVIASAATKPQLKCAFQENNFSFVLTQCLPLQSERCDGSSFVTVGPGLLGCQFRVTVAGIASPTLHLQPIVFCSNDTQPSTLSPSLTFPPFVLRIP